MWCNHSWVIVIWSLLPNKYMCCRHGPLYDGEYWTQWGLILAWRIETETQNTTQLKIFRYFLLFVWVAKVVQFKFGLHLSFLWQGYRSSFFLCFPEKCAGSQFFSRGRYLNRLVDNWHERKWILIQSDISYRM